MTAPIRIALVGIGKIVRTQHVPALAASDAFELVATASPRSTLDGVPAFKSLEELLESGPEIDAVSLCQPPQARFADALVAIEAGKHVMLEKPPTDTLSEAEEIARLTARSDATVFATWHSRFSPAVEPARAWLAGKTLRRMRIEWKEDVRVWHPGQKWIWEAGGFGVFDPGINALSIASAVLPDPLFLQQARLAFPSNCQTPIAADLAFTSGGKPVEAVFDFLQTGPQTWSIWIETEEGGLELSKGGAELAIDGVDQPLPPEAEYPGLYARFAELIASGTSDVDLTPLRLVGDAFLRGERVEAPPFVE
ncbi:Gfo/Idh/MocA family protein [Sphingomonas sp.]|uniref:Gfo/Idh/MocA family protein n=1 Tax=Sphingomonas sp. TaxID=28214 RepID=UPI003B39FD8E